MAEYTVADEFLYAKYGDGVKSSEVRVMVEGQRGVGFGFIYVPPGATARRVMEGPMVEGPWADAYGLPAVMSDCGGTRTEIDEARAEGRLIECAPGDVLVIDGFRFTVQFARRSTDKSNIELVGEAA
jgi:hypothetical protein